MTPDAGERVYYRLVQVDSREGLREDHIYVGGKMTVDEVIAEANFNNRATMDIRIYYKIEVFKE